MHRLFLRPLLLVTSAFLASALLVACGGEPGGDGDPGMVGVLRSAERTKAQTQMRLFDTCLKRHLLEQGSLPDTLEDLTEPTAGGGMPCLARVPLDPWGTTYDYRPLDDETFELVSWGPDRAEGTDDDVRWP